MVHSARASAALERRDAQARSTSCTAAVTAAPTPPAPILAASLRLTLGAGCSPRPGTPAALRGRRSGAAGPADDRRPRTACPSAGHPRDGPPAIRPGDDRGAPARPRWAGPHRGRTKVFREETHPELFAALQPAPGGRLPRDADVGPGRPTSPRRRSERPACRAAGLHTADPSRPMGEHADEPGQRAAVPAQCRTRRRTSTRPSSCTRRCCSTAIPGRPPRVRRILSNQGNALGHLGVFSDARERLTRARDMFAAAGDPDAARTVTGLLAGLGRPPPRGDADGAVPRAALRRAAAGGGRELRRAVRAPRRRRRPAMSGLRPTTRGRGLADFVDAFFAENLLEDTAGSCFVLEALERRTLPADPGGPVADVLARLARAAFADGPRDRRPPRSSSSSRSTPRRSSWTSILRRPRSPRRPAARPGLPQRRVGAGLLQETVEAITEFNRQGPDHPGAHAARGRAGRRDPLRAVDRPEVMALFVSHGIIRTDRTLDVLQVVEQIRPHLIASSIEMSVEQVRDDVAYVRFASGCSAPSRPPRTRSWE